MDRREELKAYASKLGRPGDGELESIPSDAETADPMPAAIASSPFAETDEERRDALKAHQKVQRGEPLTERDLGMLEAVVVPTGRPPLLVVDDSFEMPPAPWEFLATDAATKKRLERVIRGVGRVELHGPTSIPYAGTAFVVGPGLLMTNRHVANLFSRVRGIEVKFLDGFGAGINFVREKSREGTERAVARVVMIHPYWDMALFSVEGLEVPALPLSLTPPKDTMGAAVALVGYPASDARGDIEVQDRIFDNVYRVKRLQPGYSLGVSEFRSSGRVVSVLAHDASTLGGNSGSCVVDVGTGSVIGLHFAGDYLVANYAVPMLELARDSRIRDAGVGFTGSAEQPNPWDVDWRKQDGLAPQERPVSPAPSVRGGTGPSPSRPSPRSITVSVPLDITVRVEAETAPG